jgi:hypothetical protein
VDAFPVPNQVSQQEVGAELVDQEAKLIDQGLRLHVLEHHASRLAKHTE